MCKENQKIHLLKNGVWNIEGFMNNRWNIYDLDKKSKNDMKNLNLIVHMTKDKDE